MYERIVWALPRCFRKPVKAVAGQMLRAFGICRVLPSSLKQRLARSFSFGLGVARRTLDSIPEDQLHRTVLFLSLRPHTREAKLAEAARLAGWRPLLVHVESVKFDADRLFDFHVRVGGLIELLLVSWLFRGPLIHVFAPDGAQGYLLCIARTRPLILDINDTCKTHLVPDQPRVWERCERDAIRSADGMTHRDLRVKYLQKLYAYSLPQHNSLVIDLLPEIASRQRSARRDDEIHVVSVGWVGRGDTSVLRSIKALCADRIHVHLYINPLQRETDQDIEPYTSFRNQSPYFHFEHPVFGEAYWDQLGQYDFGLMIFEPFVFNETLISVTEDSVKGAGSSRLTDYLSAGLGVVMTPGLSYQWFLARRYATVVVAANREFLEEPRRALEDAIARKAGARVKNLDPITTRGTARRLGEFYSRVSQNVNTR